MTARADASTQRALVTGATGFVGGALVRYLAARGWTVHALTGTRTAPTAVESVLGRASVHRYDATRASLEAALEAARPYVVFHIASRVLVEHRAEDVEPLLEANVVLGTQLADAMVTASVNRLVVAGSHWQHFNTTDYEPVNLYAATKQALEAILRYYVVATPLRMRTVTLFETYGPNDPRRKVLNLLKAAAESGVELAVSPGEQLLDLVHVDDVAAAFVATAASFDTSPANEKEYAASSGHPISLRELVVEVERVLGRTVPIRWGARPYREREMMRPWAGDSPPGWQPRIGLQDGLRATLAPASGFA